MFLEFFFFLRIKNVNKDKTIIYRFIIINIMTTY